MSGDTIRRFNRYELKYLLPARQAGALMADLTGMVRPDEHGGERGYRVASLYFDSPGFDMYRAKLDGLKFRRKLRLRVYPDERDRFPRGMVEIKQRVNRTVQKRRIDLPFDAAEALCRGEAPPGALDEMDEQVVSEVRYLVAAMHLRPACVVSYWRRAFVGGRYDLGLRITFDTLLRSRVRPPSLRAGWGGSLFLPPDWCVMEVKVNDSVPDWVVSWLARHNCQLHRVSKYCAGLSHARSQRIETRSAPAAAVNLSPGGEACPN